jgi:uracil-DNA glycosylase family 4
MLRITRKADCRHCPLNGTTTKVRGLCERAQAPSIVFLGEAPGAEEELEGKPFIGPAGRYLKGALSEVGINLSTAYFTNVISCRPERNDISSEDAQEAIRCCRKGLLQELLQLKLLGAKVLVALGATARNSIMPGSQRGYVYKVGIEGEFIPFLTTFHPSYLLRGAEKEEPTWSRDLDRALQVSLGNFKQTELSLEMFPSIQRIEELTEDLLSRDPLPLLGVDIETHKSMRPFEAEIVVVGIAWSPHEAISFPFLLQGGKPAWKTSREKKRMEHCLRSLLSRCPTLFQNAPYDVQHLGNNGFPVAGPIDDVLLVHHSISPELPHNLAYIGSVYSDLPDWKSEAEDPRRMLYWPDEKRHKYNLIDACSLLSILPKLLKEVEENKTRHIYERFSKPLIPVVVELTRNGICVSQKRLKKWVAWVREELIEAESSVRSFYDLPPTFNLNSAQQLGFLFYGIEPPGLEKKRKELVAYDEPESKRRKVTRRKEKVVARGGTVSIVIHEEPTKAYTDLKSYVDLFDLLVPFPRTRARVRTTKAGQAETDEKALLAVSIAAANEIAEIEERKPTEYNRERKKNLANYRQFIDLFRKYKDFAKLESTYTEFPIGPDGRLHAWYSIHKTATGRLASSDPNLQNIPKEAREIFVPESGYVFVEGDYSNLELRVLAYEAEDDVLQAQFDAGLNVHSENCKLLFGLTENHPRWAAARKACKTYIFGMMYGGTVNGVFYKVALQVPELGLTLHRFKEIHEHYLDAHPAYVRWREKITQQVTETRTVLTANGRTRYLLGDLNSAIREGLDTPIQGTATEYAMDGTIRVFKRLHKEKFDARLVASTHDSLTAEVRKDQAPAFGKMMKEELERPQRLWGKMVSFPVELSSSQDSWGELKAIEVPDVRQKKTARPRRGG